MSTNYNINNGNSSTATDDDNNRLFIKAWKSAKEMLPFPKRESTRTFAATTSKEGNHVQEDCSAGNKYDHHASSSTKDNSSTSTTTIEEEDWKSSTSEELEDRLHEMLAASTGAATSTNPMAAEGETSVESFTHLDHCHQLLTWDCKFFLSKLDTLCTRSIFVLYI